MSEKMKRIVIILAIVLGVEMISALCVVCYWRPYRKAANTMPQTGHMTLNRDLDGTLYLFWPEGVNQDRYHVQVLNGDEVLFEQWTSGAGCTLTDIPEDAYLKIVVSSGKTYRRPLSRKDRIRMGEESLIALVNLTSPQVQDLTWKADPETKTVKIVLEQEAWEGKSHNVVLEIPGEIDEWIVLTAHYDSTSLSTGAYDNMSGSIGILAMAEHFMTAPHKRGIRMILCGSEERGLLGSKAWVRDYPQLAEKCVLNVNLDMIGSIMGKFHACVTGEDKLVGYIEYFANEMGFGIGVRQGVYSSDSSPMADVGIPAVSFARLAANNTGTIHNSYDTLKLMKAEHMAADIAFIQAFTDRMANAVRIPVKREMPDNMKERLDEYLGRKRPKEA